MENSIQVLIREVQKYPTLYAKGTVEYTNRVKRAQAWAEISQVLNMERNVCMSKWRNLRDRYVRECHRDGADENEPTWTYYSQMNFLRPYVGPKRFFPDSWKTPKQYPKVEALKFSSDSKDSKDDDEGITTASPFLYENTMDCNDFEDVKGEEDTQADNNYENGLESIEQEQILNPLGQDNESVLGVTEGVKPVGLEDKYISFMDRMAHIQEKCLNVKSSKHQGFLQMVTDKLEQLPHSDQEDAKMLFLNYLHSKIRRVRERKKNFLRENVKFMTKEDITSAYNLK